MPSNSNAVMCVHCVYKVSPHLIPDAPELIENLLNAVGLFSLRFFSLSFSSSPSCVHHSSACVTLPQESEESTCRNCFVMLFECARERAVAFLKKNLGSAKSFGEQVKLVVLDAIRKICRQAPHEKGQYFELLFECLESPSNSVSYQAALTLVSLSSSDTVVRSAAECLCRLLVQQSDNNVKLVVLDRLGELKKRFPQVMGDLVMDMLRGLATPNMDIRRKILDIALELVNSKNVDSIMGYLKKEVTPDSGKEFDGVRTAVLLPSVFVAGFHHWKREGARGRACCCMLHRERERERTLSCIAGGESSSLYDRRRKGDPSQKKEGAL